MATRAGILTRLRASARFSGLERALELRAGAGAALDGTGSVDAGSLPALLLAGAAYTGRFAVLASGRADVAEMNAANADDAMEQLRAGMAHPPVTIHDARASEQPAHLPASPRLRARGDPPMRA